MDNLNALPHLAPEAVTFTPQLLNRPCRAPNLLKENTAFHELAQSLVSDPDHFLDRLVESALTLCDGGTVGVSVESTDEDGNKIFRWVAMAGELKDLLGGTTPRNFSPCGICLDQNQPLLMRDIGRAYPYFLGAPKPFVEALLLPWGVQGGPVGTLWVVSHDEHRCFDLHDLRIMSSLAAFAFGAIYMKQKVREAERIATTISMTAAMAHHINNPLQAAVLLLYRLKKEDGLSPAALSMLSVLEVEIERISAISATLLHEELGALETELYRLVASSNGIKRKNDRIPVDRAISSTQPQRFNQKDVER